MPHAVNDGLLGGDGAAEGAQAWRRGGDQEDVVVDVNEAFGVVKGLVGGVSLVDLEGGRRRVAVRLRWEIGGRAARR